MSTTDTQTAFEFAKAAHRSINQIRKYSGEDYIVHPLRVVKILESEGERNQEILQAAYLHDVLEDVAPINSVYGAERILEMFGHNVLKYVQELTDVYTSEDYPELNRGKRKELEAKRIGGISESAMKIKLADLIDNTSDIRKHDPGFAKVYLGEKKKILDGLKVRVHESTDRVLIALFDRAVSQIE